MGSEGGAGPLWFAVCAGGLFFFYMLYGLAHEIVTKHNYGSDDEAAYFKFPSVLLVLQIFGNGLVGSLVWWQADNCKRSSASLVGFLPSSLTYLGAMYFSHSALSYISYPTQVLTKSCKPIPVLIMGLVFGQKVASHKFLCVVLIIAGIVTFMYDPAKAGGNKEDSPHGLMLLGASLVMDGFTGPNQERLFKKYKVSPRELMVMNNMWALILVGGITLMSGEIEGALAFIMAHPEILPWMGGFLVCSALGQSFIFMTISNFGSLTLSVVTTSRKFFTILLSMVWFGHEFNQRQWVGCCIVFVGLLSDVVISNVLKSRAQRSPKPDATAVGSGTFGAEATKVKKAQ